MAYPKMERRDGNIMSRLWFSGMYCSPHPSRFLTQLSSPSRHKLLAETAGILFCLGEAVHMFLPMVDDFRKDKEEESLKGQLRC